MVNKDIHLIIGYFNSSSLPKHNSEVLVAIMHNVENLMFAKIHILYEKDNPKPQLLRLLAAHSKSGVDVDNRLVLVENDEQPTYSAFFEYINKAVPNGAVAVVANSDIYFDESLACLGPSSSKLTDPCSEAPHLEPPVMYALSRRHSPACGRNFDLPKKRVFDLCEDYRGSHDAFVFTVPVHPHVVASTKHFQNRLGAENVVIFEFRRAGYVVKNPCKRIRAYHLHCSNQRVAITGERVWHDLSAVPKPTNIQRKNKFSSATRYATSLGYAPPKYAGPFTCGAPLNSPCLYL